jgi:PhoPQ-activated pathogenicity-related protein
MRIFPRLCVLAFLDLLLLTHPALCADGPETALDRYVHKADSHYHYELVGKTAHPGYTEYLLRMTSQEWRSASEVNQSVWRHWLTIYAPESVTSSTGLLFIDGGATSEQPPDQNKTLASIAITTKSIVSDLHNVPNEPLAFTNDSYGPRSEDEIIAYSWRKFLQTDDYSWPTHLPMTKAAVRAMDTVSSFMGSSEGGKVQVDHFVVAGASKRGWTTWLTAAVDSRVVAIVPMVIDVLNVIPSFKHHYESYGFWSTAVKNYYDENLMEEMDSKQYQELMEIEDPFSYRDRFSMPKLLINASGDQFFLPDSSKYYFDQLPGEKHLLYEANADHSLRGTDASESLSAFYQSILEHTRRPTLDWKFQSDGSIRLTADTTPLKVTLWQATNPEHRDFRVQSIGDAYRSSELKPQKDGVYVAKIKSPEKGWTAFFVEATFPGPGTSSFKFTTAVRVLPEVECCMIPEKSKTILQPSSKGR